MERTSTLGFWNALLLNLAALRRRRIIPFLAARHGEGLARLRARGLFSLGYGLIPDALLAHSSLVVCNAGSAIPPGRPNTRGDGRRKEGEETLGGVPGRAAADRGRCNGG